MSGPALATHTDRLESPLGHRDPEHSSPETEKPTASYSSGPWLTPVRPAHAAHSFCRPEHCVTPAPPAGPDTRHHPDLSRQTGRSGHRCQSDVTAQGLPSGCEMAALLLLEGTHLLLAQPSGVTPSRHVRTRTHTAPGPGLSSGRGSASPRAPGGPPRLRLVPKRLGRCVWEQGRGSVPELYRST